MIYQFGGTNQDTTYRKTLLTVKQETALRKFPKQKELSARIAELTELLEELCLDKEQLFCCMDCDDEKSVSDVEKEISQLEQALKQFEQQKHQHAACTCGESKILCCRKWG